jgi:hypothetical protein
LLNPDIWLYPIFEANRKLSKHQDKPPSRNVRPNLPGKVGYTFPKTNEIDNTRPNATDPIWEAVPEIGNSRANA